MPTNRDARLQPLATNSQIEALCVHQRSHASRYQLTNRMRDTTVPQIASTNSYDRRTTPTTSSHDRHIHFQSTPRTYFTTKYTHFYNNRKIKAPSHQSKNKSTVFEVYATKGRPILVPDDGFYVPFRHSGPDSCPAVKVLSPQRTSFAPPVTTSSLKSQLSPTTLSEFSPTREVLK